MQILFVDDSEPIIIEMKRILEETNHEMVVARDGGQGLAELAIKNFDIVIADLNLPRMDGLTMIEFYLKLKEEKIPKIMLTTEITADLRERGERIGVDAWMQKPLKKEVILKLLSDIENRKKVT
ncbi:MAG: response regulator [Bdellovibrionota bacterium]|nr:response regulator [Bdellovibrionota bacterium]|tara:strand:- start:275 stop:646 length:372 start_codon:yes stop_codon:yes gene_type:complete